MVWIRCAGLLNQVVNAIDLIMPRTPVPMIIARKIKHARPLDIERDIFILSKLVEEMAGVCAFIAATPIVGAPHVGARADAQIRPALPLPVRVQTNRDDWRLFTRGHGADHEQQQQAAMKHGFI